MFTRRMFNKDITTTIQCTYNKRSIKGGSDCNKNKKNSTMQQNRFMKLI